MIKSGRMNNKVLLAIGAVILIVVLGGAAFIMSNNSSKTPVSTQPTQSENPASSNNQKSLKDLIASGQAQKCTFKDKSESVDVEGTTYIDNGKMRGDFNSSVGGKSIMMHMIVSDKTSYTWMDGQTTGFKMEFDPEKMTAPTGSDQSQQSVDVNKLIDYNCSGWSVDSSVFTPPANVKFSEMGAMTIPSGVPTGVSDLDKCSVCNSLPADAKAQCRSSLECD